MIQPAIIGSFTTNGSMDQWIYHQSFNMILKKKAIWIIWVYKSSSLGRLEKKTPFFCG
jgi:hypothetical protein